jgi:hypothetical protein
MRFVWVILSVCALLQAQTPQRIKLTVERQEQGGQDNGGWKKVNAALVFDAGDKLRFRVSVNFSGYLYAMNHGTSGAYEVLFPWGDTGGDQRIEADKEYVIPAAPGSFRVAGPAGQDLIYWLVSPVALSNAYRTRPSLPPVQTQGRNSMRPRCDDSILKARGECIDDSAGIKPVAPGESLPPNLTGVAAPTPRDLLFTQESDGAVLSSPLPLTGPMIYELRLSHR